MLEELRKKPKGLREAYAFWGAAIFTGLVCLVWLASLPIRFAAVDTIVEVENQAETNSAFSQFFGRLKENLTSTWRQNKETLESFSDNDDQDNNSVSTTTTNTRYATSSTNAIIIATTTKESILIATSTKQD